MPRRRVLLVGALIVVFVVGVATVLFWPRGTTAISQEDAVTDFRSRATLPNAPIPEGTTTASPLPGVYTFAAEGEESVKLGPLPTEARPLHATVTGTVADGSNGCFTWTVNYFIEHTEATRYCVENDGLRLDQHTKHQKIGAVSPTATMTCDPSLVFVPGTERRDLRCNLTLNGGPASIHAILAGTATAGPPTVLDIGGQEVSATPVAVHLDVAGDLSGTWDETTWWTSDHLPARIERSVDLHGPATFTERSALQLVDLSPTT